MTIISNNYYINIVLKQKHTANIENYLEKFESLMIENFVKNANH
jgi:hypothetical protein